MSNITHAFIFISAVNSKQQYHSFLEWIYTAMFYVFSCFIFYDSLYDNHLLKHQIYDLTLDNINYILLISLSVCIVLLSPLLASRAHQNRKEYNKLWLEFQVGR